MTYPDLQNNRIIVNGVDLCLRFQLVLIDGYELDPPEPKTYTVDIPGGDGVIDLTESLTGDIVYSNRKQKFTFNAIYVDNFEKLKTDITNFLHGKEFDYKLTFDPGYTYHGRFSVESYSHTAYANGILGEINMTIDADPYKKKDPVSLTVDCAGGKWLELQSGRKAEYPTISVESSTIINYFDEKNNIQSIELLPGIHVIRSFKVKNDITKIYINSKRFYTVIWNELAEGARLESTWNDLKNFTWDNIHSQKKENIDFVRDTSWAELQKNKWSDLLNNTWYNYTKNVETYNSKVLIEYDMEDL